MTIDRSPGGTVWNIQILRFVASAMVLFGHLNHEVTQRAPLASGFTAFDPVWWPGGVDIFFVISGFIMYHISAEHFGRPGAPGRFVERRLIRLVPPYWFFTTLALIAMTLLPGEMAQNQSSVWHILASYLFIPAANPAGQAYPVLILGWTLNFEMLFYAIFALGLVFVRRTGLLVIAGVLIAMSAASQLAGLPLPLSSWCSPILIEFLFGIGIAMLRGQGVRLPIPLGWALAAAGAVALVLLQSVGIPGSHWVWRFLWAGAPAALMVGGLALIPEGQPGPVKRALILGGDASYALYLSHPFVLSVIAMIVGRIGMTSAAAYIAVSFVACIVAAVLTFLLLERPTYRWITRAVERRRAARRAGAPAASVQ